MAQGSLGHSMRFDTQQSQGFSDLGAGQFTHRLAACQQQIQQIIVGQIHQQLQAVGLVPGKLRLILLEKTFHQNIVFEHAAPAAPFEAAQFGRSQRVGWRSRRQMVGHQVEGYSNGAEIGRAHV